MRGQNDFGAVKAFSFFFLIERGGNSASIHRSNFSKRDIFGLLGVHFVRVLFFNFREKSSKIMKNRQKS